MKKLLLILAFLGFLTVGGCSAIDPVGPLISGVVYWVQNEAHKYYDDDTGTIYRAVKRACHELDYEIITDDPPNADGDYYVVAGSNDRFKIKINSVEKDITKLSVRVNFMGDKPYAELLYKKVDEQLSTIEFNANGEPVRKEKGRLRSRPHGLNWF